MLIVMAVDGPKTAEPIVPSPGQLNRPSATDPRATDSLPIDEVTDQVREFLRQGPNLVVVAPPGAGKTTRLPLAVLNEPWCVDRVLVTEPRRIATKNAARRMAELLHEPLGQTVGYRMRDDKVTGPTTRLEVVTDGVLLRQLLRDPSLAGISAVFFDEVHERGLDTDLSLALCLQAQELFRPDLRIIAMSATLDGARYSELLNAPVVESEGRQFPLEISWQPTIQTELVGSLARLAVDEALSSNRRVLVFLPGSGEIRAVDRRIQSLRPGLHTVTLRGGADSDVVDSLNRTSPDQPTVVLATAVAQTSLTVPGISVVIDSGLSRHAAFDARSGLSRLVTRRVSLATATQRAGRAGRIQAGRAIRMWSPNERLEPFDRPEISEGDLSQLAMSLMVWGVRSPDELRWLDPPDSDAWESAVALLQRLGAIDRELRITQHGHRMANVPVHPRLAHLLEVCRGSGLSARRKASAIAALLTEASRGSNSADPEYSFSNDVHQLVEQLSHTGGRVTRSEQGSAPAITSDRSTGTIRLARQLLNRIDGPDAGGVVNGDSAQGMALADDLSLGALLSLVYPDRIATRVGSDPGRYQLASGVIAKLPDESTLRGAEVLVAVEIDGDRNAGRIWKAVVVAADEVLDLHAENVTDHVSFEVSGEALAAKFTPFVSSSLGASVIRRRPTDATTEQRFEAFRAHVTDELLRLLLAEPTVEEFMVRWEITRAHRFEEKQPWTIESLLSTRSEWFDPALFGRTGLRPLADISVVDVLTNALSYEEQTALRDLAPLRTTLPVGTSVAIDYRNAAGPTISGRVQEFFGATSGPSIANGRIPLRIEFLAPSGRPAAIASDLASFWANGYRQVRADLRGRYPRHPWPENPASAPPTSRAKPRA